MKNKLLLLSLLALCLTWTMLVPAQAYADPAGEEPAQPAAEEPVQPEAEEPADPGLIADPFLKQDLPKLYDAGKILLSEDMTDVSVEYSETGRGLLISGPKDQLSAGRITIADRFDFGDKTAGKIAVSGLGDRGLKVTAQIFLDDGEEPVAVIPLRNQMGKKGWALDWEYCLDASGQHISGVHKVQLRLVDSSDIAGTKKIKVLLRSIEFMEESIPTLYFDIDESLGSVSAMNGDPEHDTECYGRVTVQIPDGFQCEYTDQPLQTQTYDLEYIRGRGNSTWDADKKPYKVKLDKKSDLFGMGKNKHWVLLANRFDNSLMRNKMTYWLGEQLGMEFTPKSVPVEVVMNGEYYGSYFLTQQIRVDSSRVAIDDLEDKEGKTATEEPVISGGYLLSMEPYDDDAYSDNAFSTERANWFLEHPSFEDYKNEVQMEYIKNYMQQTENAIFGKGFKSAEGIPYSDYIDIPAAVDYYWVQMLSSNGDAYGSGSTYLYKKRSGKLFWGPLWDFDYVAWGDLEYDEYRVDEFGNDTPWFGRMLKDPAFTQLVLDRWPLIKEKMGEVTMEGGLLDQYYDMLQVSRRYDVEKWGSYTDDWYGDYDYGRAGGADASEDTKAEEARSYRDEVEQLRGWITKRVEWLDKNLNKLKPGKCRVTFRIGKKTVKKITLTEGLDLGTLPKAPKKKGYVFCGWYSDGTPVTKNTECYGSAMTIKARYVKKGKMVKAKKIYLSDYSIHTSVDDGEITIGYTVMPAGAHNKTVTWKSSDSSIAEPDEYGWVRLKKTGTVTITAKVKNGPSAKCRLKIDREGSYREDFSLAKKKVRLKKGGFTQLRVKAQPAGSGSARIIWISTNKKVATVNSIGVVRAKKAGKAEIIAVDGENSVVERCSVKVLPKKGKKK